MTITLTNDDGSTIVFVPESSVPTTPEVITIPLDTDIKIVAR